jgi:outer membrane protein assembly factor BamA
MSFAAILLFFGVPAFGQSTAELLRPARFLIEPPADLSGSAESAESKPEGEGEPPQGPVAKLTKLISGFQSRDRLGPRRDDRTLLNFGNKHINAILGGLEQGAGLAFGAEFTTADSIRGVELRLSLITSTLLYFRGEVAATVPKVFNERSHGELWWSYSRRPRDPFYGIGNRTNLDDRTSYDLESRFFGSTFTYDLGKKTSTGVYISYQNTSNYLGNREDLPPIDQEFSGNPNTQPPTRYVPGLLQNNAILAYGAFVQVDYRNNSSGLTRGGYFYARLGSADSVKDGPRQDFGWIESEIDGRGYIPLGGPKTSLALRAYYDTRSPKGGSQVPFFLDTRLGGRNAVRGFNNWRFIGHNLLYYSGELRRTVYQLKEEMAIDLAALGDVGRVWGDTRSSSDPAILRNNEFSEAPWRAGYGGAVVFRYNKDVAIRMDFVHSPEKNIFYFSFSRGF